MKVLLVDDEKAARDRMRRLLGKHADVEVVGEAQSGIEALRLVAELDPEVVFLDIEMPGLDGLGVARALPHKRVVFVTAYDKFALAAFEAAAVDYLVKPIADERLTATIARLKKDAAPARVVELQRPITRFAVKSGAEYHVVETAKVTAIISDDHYTLVKGLQKELLCDETLTALETRLDATQLMRVHRTAIVNLAAVVRMEREGDRKFVLILRDGERVPVSREKIATVRHALSIETS